MSKYLVTWVDRFWQEKEGGLLELIEERRNSQFVDDFKPTQEGIREFEQSQKIEDKGNGLYWTAVVMSFSKLEE